MRRRASTASPWCTLSDYVFDGAQEVHSESEPFSPLSVYGQTKAAGDALVGSLPAHYVLRTSWVIGDGHNFVRTMATLADRGVNPEVVDDQFGRLTFTAEISRAIVHLLEIDAPYGTYNLSNDGDPMTWAGIARASSTPVAGTPRQCEVSRPLSTPRQPLAPLTTPQRPQSRQDHQLRPNRRTR